MAVVGEAHILVKAVTTGFDKDIKRQVGQLGGVIAPQGRAAGESLGHALKRGFNRSTGNIFQKVAEGLRTMAPEAEQARLAFRSLVRISYTVGTGLAALVGGVSALIGGLVALVAAIGRALPALAGIASALVQVRLAAAFAKFAFGGIGEAVSAATKANKGLGKSLAEINEEFQQLQFQAEEAALSEERAALNLEKALENLRRSADLPPNSAARREAELAYEEAELAYRRAKDRTRDLNEEVAKGPQALNDAGGNDPYAGLTESQKAFAQFLVGLRPKLDTLREAVASGFLPVLQQQIQDLVNFYFPDLEQQLKDIGTALGAGTGNIFDNFLTEETKAEVNLFLDNLEKNIPLIGEIFGELGEVLLKVFNDADGIGTQFLTWIRDTLIEWNEYLDKFGLEETFAGAYDTGSRLFGIIGNILNGLGDFFTVLEDSGAIDNILTYFEGVTGGFANLIDENGNITEAGKAVGEQFAGLTENFGPVADFLGLITKSFLDLGANPAIGEFFETLNSDENAANWDSIFKAFADAAPALGELVVTLGELFAGFADADAPTTFFETITDLIKPIAEFVSDPANKEIIDTIGRVFAFATAVSFVFEQIKNFLLVVVGTVAAFLGGLGSVYAIVKAIGIRLALVFGLSNPVGIAITAVLALVAALTWFFTQTRFGQEIWANVVEFINTSAEAMGELLGTIFENIGSFFVTLGTNISESWETTVAGLKQIWENVSNWFKDAFEGIGDFFEDVWENIGNFFKNALNGWLWLVEKFINFWIGGLNNAIRLANGGLGFLGDLIGQKLEIGLIPEVTLPRLAAGGIVMPSAGGTIAQIAEAGRPERIEPLDERGLSKRDYAMIDALRSGAGGINITVNPSPGMDEKELAAVVSRRLAYEIKRGAI